MPHKKKLECKDEKRKVFSNCDYFQSDSDIMAQIEENSNLYCGFADNKHTSPGVIIVYDKVLGARHLQCLLFFVGVALAYCNKICISLAVVAIEQERKSLNADLTSDNVAAILSSFFWGYTIMQIPYGHIARIWSAKMTLGIGMLIGGVGGMLCPLVFDNGGLVYLCACRVIIGLSQAALFPCIHTLLAKWVPPHERGRLGSMTYAGSLLGLIITYPLTAAVIEATGWRSVFYFFGAGCVLWSCIYFFLGSDSPATSAEKTYCGISVGERRYIETALGVLDDHNEQKLCMINGFLLEFKKLKTPWKAILTSKPFWALFIVHCTADGGFWFLITQMPTYMAYGLGFNIQENGLKSSLPWVTMLVMSFPISWLSDWGVRRGLPRGRLRKLSNTMGQWGPALALLGICFVTPGNTTLPVVILMLAGGLSAASMCGFQINHMDLSPNFAGLLMSITNTAASLVGLLDALVVGKIVTDWTNIAQWRTVFFMSAGIYFLGNMIFIVFGSGETQWWDHGDSRKIYENSIHRRRRSTKSFPIAT